MNSKSIQISNGSHNDVASFRLLKLNTVEEIIIGDNCFEKVNELVINGLNHLKSLKIGKNSFTTKRNDKANDTSRSFHILNCSELESIEIGEYSFSDYGGLFELKNLPKLSTIIIGLVGNDSFNFYYSSFVVEGIIDDVYIMNRSSTFEFDYNRR